MDKKITFTWKAFHDLTVEQLYALLKLRCEVFIVEQKCVYQDIDGKDRYALHLLGQARDQLVAYMRIFPPSPTEPRLIFGRVVTAPSARGEGLGKAMMKEAIAYFEKYFPGIPIHFSAQLYLQSFYESFGFTAQGNVYDEDGIPHIAMRNLKPDS